MTPRAVQPTVPFAPLAWFVGIEDDVHLAEYLGVGREAVSRWRKRGIPEMRADEMAVRVGAHPSQLWPQWFAEAEA